MARRVPAHRVTAWTTQPRSDETFPSWFARYSHLQDSTPQMFSRFLGIDQMGTPRSLWGVCADDDTIDYLAAVSRNTPESLRAVEYSTRFGEETPIGQLELSRWFVACWVRFCPECFSDDSYWRTGWEFGWNSVCLDHECLLVSGCPNCSAVRRGAFDTRTDKHFDPATCRECGFGYASAPVVEATDEQVATQQRIDAFASECSRWLRFEEAVRCLTACCSGGDTDPQLSPFGLPLNPELTLSVANEALDAVAVPDAFETLIFTSMSTAIGLSRKGVVVAPDIRPILRNYMNGHDSRHIATMDATGPSNRLNSGSETPIYKGKGSGAAA